jgi:hypothetical protein
MFVMFVYHEYIDPNHYQSQQVLCEDLSSQLTDILRKLHNMDLYACNVLVPGPAFLYACNVLIPGPAYMVCRNFAYAGTIDKILPFQDELEQMMDDIPYYSRMLRRLSIIHQRV